MLRARTCRLTLAPAARFAFPAPVSDRLSELQRQRALLLEHLAWLEREIAAQKGGAGPEKTLPRPSIQAALAQNAAGSASARPPSPIASVTVIPVTPAPSPADADALIQQYGYDPKSSSADVKRGCWTAFAASFLVVGLLVLVAWWLLRRT